jgi:flavin reductase (DIM6/NTAB) family NADH-FMN oxidoreductase RutF
MHINPDEIEGQQRYKLLIGSVLPRPIAFVSTVGKDGVRNLAPFSFFNAVCFNPMIIAFFPLRYKKANEIKDTVRNIRETGEFCVNVSTENILDQLNQTSGLYPYESDEFVISGLTPVSSEKISVPGVKESLIRFECRLEKMISFGDDVGGSDAIFGRVVHLFVDDDIIDNYRIDEQKLRPVARLAGNKYSLLGDIIEIERPG